MNTLSGILEMPNGTEGRIRQLGDGLIESRDDPFVPRDLAERYTLREGQRLTVNVVSAVAWSMDFSGGAARELAPQLKHADITSTVSIPGEVPFEVRLRSTVRPEGNGYGYRYLFQNFSDR